MFTNPVAYEQLLLETDPYHREFVFSNKLVEEFIRERKLIIYGGTAIDLSLRLKGSALYPDFMLETADYDFLSPDHAEDAYKLVDILAANGFKAARAITAFHMSTMRIDMADNHWIGDISYIPPDVFSRIKYLNYKGMRIIHPDIQKVDMHSSLSFPYDGAPKEVIFARWKKDVTRFNMYEKAYPAELTGSKIAPLSSVTISGDFTRSVIHGFAAYALMYYDYINNITQPDPAIISAPLEWNDEHGLTFNTLEHTVDVVSIHPADTIAHIDASIAPVVRRPFINLLPRRVILEHNKVTYVAHDTNGRMLSMVSIDVGDKRFRVVCVQYLLKWLISMSVIKETENMVLRDTYMSYYISLLRMVRHADSKIPSLDLSIKTYGADNDPESYMMQVSRIRSDLYREKVLNITPTNYKAETGKGVHPKFGYEHHVFHDDGRIEDASGGASGGGEGSSIKTIYNGHPLGGGSLGDYEFDDIHDFSDA